MRTYGQAGAMVLLMGLTGCYAGPPLPPPVVPLVAVPGPAKSQEAFRQDDAVCRAAAVTLPADAAHSAGGALPAANAAPAAGQNSTPGNAQQAAAAQPPAAETYLRCMADRDNVVQPVAQLPAGPPPYYGYYPPYPLYADYTPFLYGPYVGFGFYGGCCGGFRNYGGFHGGYGGGFGGRGR